MAKRKLKLTEKIILLSTLFMAIFLIGFWLSLQRTGRKYILPVGFSGWVTIQYSQPDASPLPLVDGFWELKIPPSGYLETSSQLEKGWGKDVFFWEGPEGQHPIPNYTESSEGLRMHIHGRDIRHYSHEDLLQELPVGTDTTLWDGTQLSRPSESEVSYRPGKVSLEYFYLFDTPQLLDVPLPPNPGRNALESMEDHLLTPDS